MNLTVYISNLLVIKILLVLKLCYYKQYVLTMLLHMYLSNGQLIIYDQNIRITNAELMNILILQTVPCYEHVKVKNILQRNIYENGRKLKQIKTLIRI